MNARRLFLGSVCGAVLSHALAGCAGWGDEPVAIAAHVWPGYEPMFLAQREGWLDVRKVRLVESSSATDSLQALMAGRVDGAALTLDEVLKARGRGLPLSVVMVFDISAGADMLVVRPDIRQLSDLKGRTVCFEQGAVGELMLYEILRAAGLKREDVKAITLPIDWHLDAWRGGEVDAVVSYEPVASQLLARGGVRLFDSRRVPDAIVDVLAIRSDVLDRRHANAIRLLLEGCFRALVHLQHNPQDAAYRMVEHLQMARAGDVLAAFRGLVLPDLANNRRLLAGESPALLANARNLVTLMVGNGLLEREDDLASLIRPDYLPADAPAR